MYLSFVQKTNSGDYLKTRTQKEMDNVIDLQSQIFYL